MRRGTLVVGQSGGATAVINATLAGLIDAGRESGAFSRILGLRNGMAGLLEGRVIDLTNHPQEIIDGLRGTPSAALGTSRYKADEEAIDRALVQLEHLDATLLVLIGGNDSADSAWRLHQRASELGSSLRILLAPKTVDNDLPETDHCPGFPSIARFLANAVRDATYDSLCAPNLTPVKFIDVMGRDAGWVAASCCLAFTAEERDLLPLTYLPERAPHSLDQILDDIDDRVRMRGFVVGVVPETLRDSSGVHMGGSEPTYVDPFGHPYHDSPAAVLARLVSERLGLTARVDRPGTASRASVSLASPVDQDEAYRVGKAAVTLGLAGESGRMVRLIRVSESPYRSETGSVELGRIANLHRQLPEIFISSDGRSITDAFRRYALPLLGENPFPAYVRLPAEPRHIRAE